MAWGTQRAWGQSRSFPEVHLIADVGAICNLHPPPSWNLGCEKGVPPPRALRKASRKRRSWADSSGVMLRALGHKGESGFGPWCWVGVEPRTPGCSTEGGQDAAPGSSQDPTDLLEIITSLQSDQDLNQVGGLPVSVFPIPLSLPTTQPLSGSSFSQLTSSLLLVCHLLTSGGQLCYTRALGVN